MSLADARQSSLGAHWNRIYREQEETALTWFQEIPAVSMGFIGKFAKLVTPVIDVGGGASRLVDGLLTEGFADITVLDLADEALQVAKARLGVAAAKVDWICADVTTWQPDRRYGLWHDRAVFHFLTAPAARAAYVKTLLDAVEPGGVAVISTFHLEGPTSCSGLPVARYSPETLNAELAALAPGRFTLIDEALDSHETPGGDIQEFQVSVFRVSEG